MGAILSLNQEQQAMIDEAKRMVAEARKIAEEAKKLAHVYADVVSPSKDYYTFLFSSLDWRRRWVIFWRLTSVAFSVLILGNGRLRLRNKL